MVNKFSIILAIQTLKNSQINDFGKAQAARFDARQLIAWKSVMLWPNLYCDLFSILKDENFA